MAPCLQQRGAEVIKWSVENEGCLNKIVQKTQLSKRSDNCVFCCARVDGLKLFKRKEWRSNAISADFL